MIRCVATVDAALKREGCAHILKHRRTLLEAFAPRRTPREHTRPAPFLSPSPSSFSLSLSTSHAPAASSSGASRSLLIPNLLGLAAVFSPFAALRSRNCVTHSILHTVRLCAGVRESPVSCCTQP